MEFYFYALKIFSIVFAFSGPEHSKTLKCNLAQNKFLSEKLIKSASSININHGSSLKIQSKNPTEMK
jgi:hypothetical protein